MIRERCVTFYVPKQRSPASPRPGMMKPLSLSSGSMPPEYTTRSLKLSESFCSAGGAQTAVMHL